ncbi:MAG TPA: hypothetical protein VMQ65_10485 [Candidatus Limnocylindria bacterium]|nr:hypothetical protein [Candidatus Limnocylindria bacterium]
MAQRSAEGGPEAVPALGSGLPETGTDRSGAPALPELVLPHLPVQRSADAPSLAPVADPPATALAPTASGPEIRPTAGANPIRPSIEIQRAASDDGDDQAPDDELPSPWWNPAAAPASDHAQANTTMPGLGGAATPVSTSIQRSAAGHSTAPTIATISPRGEDRGRPVRAGRSAPVAPPVQRITGSALYPSALPQPVGVGSRHGATVATSVIESAAVAPTPSSGRVIGGPVVQTSPAGSPAPAAPAVAASSFGSPAVVQREEGSAPAAPAPGGSGIPSERDLDELAQALFGRIRGRLRSDLIYDREAKGLTFDNV